MKKILNLYAGIGGNRKLWSGDIQVTAVEMNPKIAAVYQDLFPLDVVVVGDAHQYLLEHFNDFDFIWTSPPCPSHSKLAIWGRHTRPSFVDASLIQEIIFLKTWCKAKFVVENVKPYYNAILDPVRVGRHFLWSNFYIPQFKEPETPKGFIGGSGAEYRQKLMDWLGIHLTETLYAGNNSPEQVFRNCVHPLTGLHIYKASLIY